MRFSTYLERTSRCCQSRNNLLASKTSWPPYLHLKNQLEGKVMWLSTANESNVLIADVVQTLARNVHFIQDTVVHIEKTFDWDLTTALGSHIQSHTLIFANGGYGAEATSEELQSLAVADTK